MKVIVFGGSGFLGSHVADALTAAGHAATIFDIRPSPYRQKNQRFIQGDVLRPAEVRRAMRGHQAVYHFAGFADLDAARDQAVATVHQNVLGCVNLLEAARQTGIRRFIFASSIYVYSQSGGFYRVSKQACESYIEEYQRRYGMDYTILRFGTLYGRRADPRNSVYRYLHQALTERRITARGSGDEMREYVHVQDAARVAADIIKKEYRNQNFVITGHHPIRYRDLLLMIREILDKNVRIELKPASPDDSAHYSLTPYTFQPKIGRKLVTSSYLDMGQGLLDCLQEIHDSLKASGPAGASGRARLSRRR